MKYLLFFFIPILMIFTSSCTSPQPEKTSEVQETPTVEAKTDERKPVFVYGQKSDAEKIDLRFGGEPIPTSSGYLKLVGTIGGVYPQAIIEIGGKGKIFSSGDNIGSYKIVSIKEMEVKLCLKKLS